MMGMEKVPWGREAEGVAGQAAQPLPAPYPHASHRTAKGLKYPTGGRGCKGRIIKSVTISYEHTPRSSHSREGRAGALVLSAHSLRYSCGTRTVSSPYESV